MDMEYLLALQNFRQGAGAILENIMLAVSFVCDGPLLVVIALVIYWCVNKRMGQLAIVSMAASNFVCQFAKNVMSVYRPWVADTRIVPSQGAIDGAAGYSFPSGHTSGAVSIFGSIAWTIRKNHKAISLLCVVFILAVMFSRNYLGVHTPQDVLVGLLLALVIVALSNMLLSWIDHCDAENPGHKRDIAIAITLIALCALSIAVVELKPYPMDYVDGVLLVDPENMKKGSFEAAGLLSGTMIGWVCERRFVGFGTGADVTKGERVMRGVAGVLVVGVSYFVADVAFKAFLPYLWAKMCAYLVLSFVAVFVVPLFFGPIGARFKR